jgi:hypothetical protein
MYVGSRIRYPGYAMKQISDPEYTTRIRNTGVELIFLRENLREF